MIAHDLHTKFRNWLARRKYERRWRRSTPGEQAACLVEMLHHSPELRRAFRDALFGKTHQVRKIK